MLLFYDAETVFILYFIVYCAVKL